MGLAVAIGPYPSKAAAARALGIPVSTYKSRLSKGHKPRAHLTLVQDFPIISAIKSEPRNNRRSEWYATGNRIVHDGPGGGGNLLELERLPETLLIYSCLQAPFHHVDAIPFLSMVKAQYAPDLTVCAGDELDLQFLKKAFMGADSPGPLLELQQGQEVITQLGKIFPRQILLTSNHVKSRIKFAQAQGNIPSPFLRDFRDVIQAPPEWLWRDYLVLGSQLIEHGHDINIGARGSIVEQTIKRFGRPLSIARGHVHSEMGEKIAPIWVEGGRQVRLTYVGCLVDPMKMTYSRAPSVLGCTLIIRGVPHPVPLVTDRNNRWIGRLIEWR